MSAEHSYLAGRITGMCIRISNLLKRELPPEDAAEALTLLRVAVSPEVYKALNEHLMQYERVSGCGEYSLSGTGEHPVVSDFIEIYGMQIDNPEAKR